MLLDDYYKKIEAASCEISLNELKLRECENEGLESLAPQELETRARLLSLAMGRQKLTVGEDAPSEDSVSEPEEAQRDLPQKFSRRDAELLFPAKLKSYYASGEL